MDTISNPHVHDRFALMAAVRGDATAVEHDGRRISYVELDQRVDRLAHRLRDLGAKRGSVVMVHLERSIEFVVSLLATLKAGAAYLPVDPGVPGERLAAYVKETGCAIAVTHVDQRDRFASIRVTTVEVDDTWPTESSTIGLPSAVVEASDTAYVIYTSGSTGSPKAVEVSHASLGYLCQNVNSRYGVGPGDRVLQFAALSFDTSIEQILNTLLHGATLVLPEYAWAPSELPGRLMSLDVTVMDLTPPYWRAFLTELARNPLDLPVRLTIVGGSAVHAEDCRVALSLMPRSRLVNAYGLTETAITSCTMEITPQALPRQGPAPVGRPLPGTVVRVLDEDLNPVPFGHRGEIYLGGPGVAQGYLGAEAQNDKGFLTLPMHASAGEVGRFYRTGDLGGWTTDGHLEIVGRIDRQLKIRGFRIEPSEIEATLSAHDLLNDATVTSFSHHGEEHLVAYFTAHEARRRIAPGTLRAFTRRHLPTYMVPTRFVQLAEMPMTANGKVDLTALPDASGISTDGPGADDTRSASLVERAVVGLWCQVLDVPSVEPEDNFFDLGGNSILAAELLAKVRGSLGVLVTQVRPLIRLLLDGTLRSFASAVEAARAGTLSAEEGTARTDLRADTAVGVPIQAGPTSEISWVDPSHVFLTGATGFLGIYLLRDLLADTDATVHCLVRARNAQHAMERIQNTARRYLGVGLDEHYASGRISVVPGDLARPLLGLTEADFDRFARTVDVIHHPGGLVNFIYPYSHMRSTNVEGTREIIRMAGRYRNIPVHYVSTMAVISGFGTAGVRHVTEETPLDHPDRLSVGYVESKWVAEGLLLNAAKEGLPVAIYRAADISGDRETGAWNTSTEMCAMKKFVVDTGTAPVAELPLDYTPVDCFAAGLLHTASSRLPAGEIYHLTNPRKANISLLVERLRAHGHTIQELPWDEWVDGIVTIAVEQPDHPMTPFAPLFIDRCSTGEMSVAEMYLETTFPVFSRDNVENALNGSGIEIPPVDDKMLDRYIRYLTSIDFL